MNAYLHEFPPLVQPPADLPFFDVRRIAATLRKLNKEAGMWQGAAKLALERAEYADRRATEARAVVRATDRFCNCLHEFGAEGIGYCSEWLEALELALLNYAAYESGSAARPAAAEEA